MVAKTLAEAIWRFEKAAEKYCTRFKDEGQNWVEYGQALIDAREAHKQEAVMLKSGQGMEAHDHEQGTRKAARRSATMPQLQPGDE